MSFKLKFGNEAAGMLSDISAINDMKLLETIAVQIPNISSTDEFQKLLERWLLEIRI